MFKTMGPGFLAMGNSSVTLTERLTWLKTSRISLNDVPM